MAAFGIDSAEVEDALAGDDETDCFEVWPENEESLTLFLAQATQWRFIASPAGGEYTGLNYASVLSSMDMLGIKNRRAAFEDIRVMERAALDALNKR